jgi:hypothetical protein
MNTIGTASLSSSISDRSAWEEGLDMIDSLLQAGSPTEAAMTEEQRGGLKKLKRMLLLSGVHSAESHIPISLLMSDAGKNSDSRRYLLSNFGGYTPPDEDAGERFKQIVSAHKAARKLRIRALAARPSVMVPSDEGGPPLPARWKALDSAAQHKLRDLMQWENLSRWDFDVFDVHEVVGGVGTLVFVAWAILASPHAQYAMDWACSKSRSLHGAEDGNTEDPVTPMADRPGYQFAEQFGIREETLVEFLDIIETRYSKDAAYHNSIHAADVLQTLHAMLQGGGVAYIAGGMENGSDDQHHQHQKLELFGLLLAAVIHDVGHPGLNNLFQVHSRSDLALLYNDNSVLENMHLATAFQLIMGEDRDERADIFESFTDEQISVVRQMVITTVLDTDMTKHFVKNNYIKGILMSRADEGTDKDGDGNVIPPPPPTALAGDATMRRQILGYFLHLSDISNPAKPIRIGTQWTDRVLEEFFLQGDREAELALPVSPLCCRQTTSRAQSQIGFINFVVLPAYELLGQLIPMVATDVVPVIRENLAYWQEQKRLEGET